MKVRVISCEPYFDTFAAKCAEVTKDDLQARVVYVKFTVTKPIGYELELENKRIKEVELPKKGNKPARKIWVHK